MCKQSLIDANYAISRLILEIAERRQLPLALTADIYALVAGAGDYRSPPTLSALRDLQQLSFSDLQDKLS